MFTEGGFMDAEKIRGDFPILQRRVGGKPIVYFDNACMTLKPVHVMEAMNRYYMEFSACVGRSGHRLSSEAEEAWAESRKTIGKHVGAKKSEEIVFTRNTTEGINIVARCLGLRKGDVVVTSDREHNSNLVPWQTLSKEGVEHRIFKAGDSFDIAEFEEVMDRNVKLVSVVHTSNLDGVTLPLKEISRLAHDYGALVLADGAQAVPHKDVNVRKLGVDFYAFSGHKMLGPTGTGALYGRYELLERMEPLISGGDTVEYSTYSGHKFLKPPERFEAGLQDYAGMIGFAEAARYLDRVGKERVEKHVVYLNRIITEGLSGIDGLRILGPEEAEQRSGIFSFVLEGMGYHDVAMLLDNNANIMVRSGQHCVHSWFRAHGIEGSVRASLYLYNTEEEAESFVDEVRKIAKLR